MTLGLAACGKATPLDYVPEADEMKSGSGLFSDKDGEFVIYRKPRAEPAEHLNAEKRRRQGEDIGEQRRRDQLRGQSRFGEQASEQFFLTQ